MRTLVRLGFHDCISASGTCDGCIDLDDPENNGVGTAVNALTPHLQRARHRPRGLLGRGSQHRH